MKAPIDLLLTGGGTAGHVIPQVGLIQYIQSIKQPFRVAYVGSYDGIEKKLIDDCHIPYYGISTGKWRRYMSFRNLFMPFQVLYGIFQVIRIFYRLKPALVFSKGGFVAVPVVIVAWLLGVSIVVHESDLVPGLANRLSFPFAKSILYSFSIPGHNRYAYKSEVTGLPTRLSLTKGITQKGFNLLQFSPKKPVLFIWGGSLGAMSLNTMIVGLLPALIQQFQVVHVWGVGKLPHKLPAYTEYRSFEYLDDAWLPHILKVSDLVVSRAGATAIYELLLLHKAHLLCPLSNQASRGEQIKNARYFENQQVSSVIYPKHLTAERLLEEIRLVYHKRLYWQSQIRAFNLKAGNVAVYDALVKHLSLKNT